MSFLKKSLQIAEDRLAKVLHTTFEPEVREQQVIYYQDQIAEIKTQLEKRRKA
jgi:hypothetical protein